nr:MAG TPA: hypothetical protein [Caudoviricetes sp.]
MNFPPISERNPFTVTPHPFFQLNFPQLSGR